MVVRMKTTEEWAVEQWHWKGPGVGKVRRYLPTLITPGGGMIRGTRVPTDFLFQIRCGERETGSSFFTNASLPRALDLRGTLLSATPFWEKYWGWLSPDPRGTSPGLALEWMDFDFDWTSTRMDVPFP
jgi:hypothetical protein